MLNPCPDASFTTVETTAESSGYSDFAATGFNCLMPPAAGHPVPSTRFSRTGALVIAVVNSSEF
jgi:hypothetical protein